jgi:PAS domain S-box-containing protein
LDLLNIILLEDNESDADLILRELKKSGFNFTAKIVQNRIEFELALQDFKPDLILSDYSLPSFDAVTAFRITQQKNAHLPFIIVSGIIGEENAVELIKDGVTDYVSKQKLFTLATKINRALKDVNAKKEKVVIDQRLIEQTAELRFANQELLIQNQEKEVITADLIILSKNLKIQQNELIEANNKLIGQKQKIKTINLELSVLNQELETRVAIRTKALTESENRFRSMMETIPQIAWTNTAKGKVIFYNQRWYDYTGLTPTGINENALNLVIHPDDLNVSTEKFHSILRAKDGGEFQVRGKRADGLYRWHLIRLMPIFIEKALVKLWIGTATDIQELKLLQQHKDDFITIASHELKTPITSLKAALQFLDRIKNNPSAKTLPMLIEQANKSLNKINILIEDLLNASMANEGKLLINQKTFNIGSLITECCNNIHHDGIYTISTRGNMATEVYADAVRIEQVIVNFVNNAIKYAPESKEIVIDVEKVDDWLKVAVIDTGSGIAAEKLPHLFDRYYQVNSSQSNYTGLGLGLYICEEIIKKHNGKIGVTSQLGKGSSFWFTLPIA